jgi:hypothetical protein
MCERKNLQRVSDNFQMLYDRKKRNQTAANIGRRIGRLYRKTYPKKLGHFTPVCSAIDLTMKFGPFPI